MARVEPMAESPRQTDPRGARVDATTWLLVAVLAIMGLRLAMLGWPAITDPTESRHAVIGLRMAESGDWVTPRAVFGGRLMPFWGKPPLQFWLTAASFRLFGVSEWSARLPAYLAAVAMLLITFAFARRFWGREAAAASTAVLAGSLLFFGLAGSVTLDVALSASSAAAMAAFACFAAARDARARRGWGIAFAAALALGMLIKGPIAVVFAVLSVVVWAVIFRRWNLLAAYPWFSGLAVFFAASAPWYLLAERATPGFLRYFFVNEHILRYVSHEYGDLYGSGHTRAYGSVWLMLLAAALPWTVVLVRAAAARFGRWRGEAADPWLDYVLIWALVPPLFFTFARQLLATYLLPGFPGLAVLAGVALASRFDEGSRPRFTVLLRSQLVLSALASGALAVWAFRRDAAWPAVLAVALALALLASALGWPSRRVPALVCMQALGAAALVFLAVAAVRADLDDGVSTKTILAAVARDRRLDGKPIVFPRGDEQSGEFYAHVYLGREIEHLSRTGDPAVLAERLRAARSNDLLLLDRQSWLKLDTELKSRTELVAETSSWVALLPRAVP
jgi:4-amino-4-deoxy-L-arabinose transferase-like glycosyltransferase